MTFRDFHDFYLKRKSGFERDFQKDVLTKTYIKLQKGSEIRVEDINRFQHSHNRAISEILIDVPQVKMVKENITQSLTKVEVSNEADVRIVYGDYGHGKSQTAHLLIEQLRSKRKTNWIIYLENISTFRDFLHKFSSFAKEQLETNYPHQLSKVEPILDLFEKCLYDETISTAKLIQSFLRYLKQLSSRSIVHILFIDELDKIIQDEVELKIWIDFFVSINDESDLLLLLVLLIPQTLQKDLINYDRRMERWDIFFSINATILDGRYSAGVANGIANIVALSDQYHHTSLNQKSLEFIYKIVDYKMEYLHAASIRRVNTWGIIMSKLMLEFEEKNIWDIHKSILKRDRTQQGLDYEKKLKLLLQEDHLPQFQLEREDSDEIESYRVEFSKENLKIGSHFSDGHFKLYISFTSTEQLKHTIAAEIKYTTENYHQEKQIKKVISLADQYPVVFFSLGLLEEDAKKLRQELQKIQKSNIRKYPIMMVNIPLDLLPPLLLLPDDNTIPGFNQKVNLLIQWSKIITSHREKLSNYLRDLPSEMIVRKVLLRSHELADIEISSSDIPSVDKEKQKVETDGRTSSKIFIAANIVSMLEQVSSYKYLSTIEKSAKKTINTQFPTYASELIASISMILNLLQAEGYIERGGGSNVTIKKTDNWNEEKAINFLKSSILK